LMFEKKPGTGGRLGGCGPAAAAGGVASSLSPGLGVSGPFAPNPVHSRTSRFRASSRKGRKKRMAQSGGMDQPGGDTPGFRGKGPGRGRVRGRCLSRGGPGGEKGSFPSGPRDRKGQGNSRKQPFLGQAGTPRVGAGTHAAPATKAAGGGAAPRRGPFWNLRRTEGAFPPHHGAPTKGARPRTFRSPARPPRGDRGFSSNGSTRVAVDRGGESSRWFGGGGASRACWAFSSFREPPRFEAATRGKGAPARPRLFFLGAAAAGKKKNRGFRGFKKPV